MFKVLLPVSDEEHALAAAEAVLSLPNVSEEVEVTIVNAQENIDRTDGSHHIDSDDWYDDTDLPPSVYKTKEYLEENHLTVEVRRRHADPQEAIIEVANEINADRIVMSGKKRSPTGKMVFGSVTQSILLHSDIPVTVILK